VLGEDVEDEGGPVDDLDLDDLLELTQLAGRELTVADDRVGAGGPHDVAELVGLAGADVRRRVRLVAALDHALEHLRTRGLGQGGELGERVLGVTQRPAGPHADEDDALQPQLAVLDLGDVLELGGQARDAPEGVTLLEVETLTLRLEPRPGSFVANVIGGRRGTLVERRRGR
jgi:hypothetical protein